jgi:hypothetical protein
MIRLTFAWVLLFLTISPFTAPFSTCDLGALLGHVAVDAIAIEGHSVQCVSGTPETDPYGDACTVASIVTTIEPMREQLLTGAGRLAEVAGQPAATAGQYPSDVILWRQAPAPRPAVLRI